MEEEELLLLADLAVVTLGGLLEILLVLNHHSLIGERDTVDTLKRVVLGITEEVGSRVLFTMSVLWFIYVGVSQNTFMIWKALILPV